MTANSPLMRRTAILLAAALLAVLVVRGDVQRWIARGLVVDADVPAAGPLWVLPHSGDRVEETAAALTADRPDARCLVLRGRPLRVESLGAIPPRWQLHRDALVEFGVDADRIEVLDVEGDAQWDWLRTLSRRLQADPQARVVLLCDQFGTRRMNRLVAHVAPAVRDRITVVPLRDRRFDETNWWKNRLGTRHVAGSWFSLAAFYLFDEVEVEYRSPDEYVREAEGRFAGVGSSQ